MGYHHYGCGLVIFLLYVLFPIQVASQSPSPPEWDEYLIRNFTAQNGLPGSSTYFTGKDAEGFIWMGTKSGLATFDGVKITSYSGANYPVVGTTSYYSMLQDSKGTLWFSSRQHGAISYSHAKFSVLKTDPPLTGSISKYLEITEGDSLWISSYASGLSLVYQDSLLKTYNTSNGLVYDMVWMLFLDSKGWLWVATNGGLNIMKGDSIKTFTTANGLSYDILRAVEELENGEVWVGSDGNGITVFKDYEPVRHLTTGNGLTNGFVQFIKQNPIDKSVWIGNYETGVDRYFKGEISNFSAEDGLISNETTHIFFEENGSAWISTEAGTTQLRLPKATVPKNIPAGLDTDLLTVTKTADGQLWFGLNGNGILIKDEDGWSQIEKNELSTNGYVNFVYEDSRGDIWYGTQGSGMGKIKNGKEVAVITEADGLSANYSRDLAEDSAGNLWIGSPDGLSVINANGKAKNFDHLPALDETYFFCVAFQQPATLWAGSLTKGLFRFTLDRDNISDIHRFTTDNSLKDNSVAAMLLIDKELAFFADGLGNLYLYKDDRFYLFSFETTFSNLIITSILRDSDNYVWLASNVGLLQTKYEDYFSPENQEKATVPFKLYTQEDGLAGVTAHWNDNKLVEDKQGNIVYATKTGPAIIPRAEKDRFDAVSKVHFSPIAIDGEIIDIEGDEFELTHQNRTLEIGLRKPLYYTPSKVMYKYMLEGVDKDWHLLRERNTLFYDFLPDGEYTLKVMSTNEMGTWGEEIQELTITVLPPFYKTLWFRGIALISFGLIVAGAVRVQSNIKVRRLNQELSVQQKIQNERERISRDLHDNVGSQITNLITGIEISNMYIQKKENSQAMGLLERLDKDARGAMTELRETIWLLDKESVLISDFVSHLKSYVKRNQYALKGLQVNIKNELSEAVQLNPGQSLHLLRIIQEALNNCRKYAEASCFEILLRKQGTSLIMSVSDNGKGMNMNELENAGNGLKNMQTRANEIEASFEISSSPGQGTAFHLEIPILP